MYQLDCEFDYSLMGNFVEFLFQNLFFKLNNIFIVFIFLIKKKKKLPKNYFTKIKSYFTVKRSRVFKCTLIRWKQYFDKILIKLIDSYYSNERLHL